MKTVKPLLTIGSLALIDIAVKCIASMGGSNTVATLNLNMEEKGVLVEKLDMDEESFDNAIKVLSAEGLENVEAALDFEYGKMEWHESRLFAVQGLHFKKKDGTKIEDLNGLNPEEKDIFNQAVGKAVELVKEAKTVDLLEKIGLDLMMAVNKDNVVAVNAALDGGVWDTLIQELNKVDGVDIVDPQNLTQYEKDYIVAAVRKAVAVVALDKIGLTPEGLEAALNIYNLATVEEALKQDVWDEFIRLLNTALWSAGLEAGANKLTAADEVLIKAIVRNLVKAARNDLEWKQLAYKLGNETMAMIGKLNLTNEQVNGLFMLSYDGLPHFIQLNNYAKAMANDPVTGAAEGIYLSSVVLLARLAAWYLI